MALSASLSLDIKAFQAGLDKAEVELQVFERATKNMNRDLKRLMEDFSGQKVVVEAQRMAEAVQRIGGASKLTEGEQRRVNASVTEALAKYKALGQEAPAHLVKLQTETAKVEKVTAGIGTPVSKLPAMFSAAAVAGGTLAAAVAGLSKFVERGGEVAGMRNAFDKLSGGVDAANIRIGAIRTSTQGLVDDFSAMQASNKATLLGLGLSSDKMGELAKTATILGRAMGQDATKSLDDLITALGRSSPMILDNLGLSVKVEEANQKYAAALGKTADSLTDAEKKQAFMNAAMDAANEKVKILGDIQLNAADQASQLWTGIKNLADATASWAVSLPMVNDQINRIVESMRFWETTLRSGKLSEAMREFNRLSGGATPKMPEAPKSWLEMPKALQAITLSKNDMAAADRELTASIEKMIAPWEKFNAELAKFGGNDAIKRADELVRVIGALGGPLKVLPSQLASMATAFQDAAAAAQIAGKNDLAAQYAAMAKTLSPVVQLQQRYNVTIGEFATTSDDFSQAVREQVDVLTQVEETLHFGIIPNLLNAAKAWETYKAAASQQTPASLLGDGPKFGEMFKKEMQAALGDVSRIIVDVIVNGGSLRQGVTAIASRMGAAVGGSIGAYFGGPAGQAIGQALGSLAGPILDKAIGLFTGPSAQKDIAKRVKSSWGVAISEGLAQAIAETAKTFGGNRQAAEIFSLDRIIGEGGGLNAGNLATMMGKLRDVFSMVQSGAFTAAQAATVLDKNFGAFVTAATDASGRISPSLKEIIRLTREMGIASKEVEGFLKGQGSAVLEGFNKVAADGKGKWKAFGEAVKKAADERKKALEDGSADDTMSPTSEKGKKFRVLDDALTQALAAQHGAAEAAGPALKDLGIQAVSAFNAALASGMSFSEALKQIQPGLQSIIAAYDSLGINIDDTALKFLAMQSQLLEKNPEILAGLDGLSQGLVAMSNLGLLNEETFASMQRTAMDMFTRIQGEVAAMGGSQKDALIPMQKYLQEAAAAAEELGIPLDANTQMLIDQSKELGIWRDKGKDPMQEMVDVTKEMRDAIKEMVDAIKGIPRKTTTEIETKYTTTGNPPSGSGGTNTTQPSPGPSVSPKAANSVTKNAGRSSVVVPVYIDGRQVAEATVPYIPGAIARRGV